MLMKLMTGAALAAAVLAGTASAETQSFQSVVESFYHDEFRAHPIAATDLGVHDYDAEVDDLSRDGQAKNIARLHKALDAFIAIDPANLSAGDRDDRETLINSIKGKLLDAETILYWQKDPDVYVSSGTAAVFNLVRRDFAPLADRLRSVIARERQIPMLLAAGKANVEHPPPEFVDIDPKCRGLDRFPKDRCPCPPWRIKSSSANLRPPTIPRSPRSRIIRPISNRSKTQGGSRFRARIGPVHQAYGL